MEVVHGEIFDGSQGMSDNGPGSLATVESETASEIASEVESEPAMLIELTYDAKSSKSEDEIGEVVILIDSSDDASNDAYIDNANAEEVITGTNGYDDTEQASKEKSSYFRIHNAWRPGRSEVLVELMVNLCTV